MDADIEIQGKSEFLSGVAVCTVSWIEMVRGTAS